MATSREIENGRAGLKRVIDDLQNEHTRFQNRLDALKTKGPDEGMNHVEKHLLRVAYLEDKLEYIELILRRYRSWLHD